MNPSHLQQLINDKETELTKIRSLANEAALQREHAARETAQRMENEVQRIQKDCDDTIKSVTQQLEREAEERIQQAIKEMEICLEHRQDEIYAAATEEMEKKWHEREDSLKEEVRSMLESELEAQHAKLAAHYEAIIYNKECDMKLIAKDTKQQLADVEERHQSEINAMRQQMDQIANEIWNEAREQFASAAENEIAQSLATTKSQCKELEDENAKLRQIVNEKERIIKDNIREMNEMEDTFQDVASEVSRAHSKEMAEATDHISRLMHDNDRLKKAMHEISNENTSLIDELDHCRMMNKSLEVKCKDQMKVIETVDMSKSESSSRINELAACNELLKRQLTDMASEQKALVAEKEKLCIKISDVTSENKKQAATIDDLRETKQSNEAKYKTLTDNLSEAKQQIESLANERQAYTAQTNQLLDRNEKLHSEKIRVYEEKVASAKDEADSLVQSAQQDLQAMSSECNNLRSRILQLQRDNFRLEQDLMDSHQLKQRLSGHNDQVAKPQSPTHDTHKLKEENKALKEIISMMRESVESAVEGNAESSRESIIERQLYLCRAYLDLLLNTSNTRTKYDELSFLRRKNQELLQMLDQLRHESRVGSSSLPHARQRNGVATPSIQEQQLISRLEEATDEIDALLQERDQLVKLSNQLKFELQQAHKQIRLGTATCSKREEESHALEEEGADGQILEAILNDFSTSCDGESNDEPEVIACMGMKPPTGTTANIPRPKTASDRATSSQQQSYQRMLKSIKKKQAALQNEKAKIQVRNWSIKR